MDALLGAAGLGDIGQHFPDTDDRFLGIDSQKLLTEVCGKIRAAGYEISNLDATVIAQKPKLMAYLPQMRQTLAATMGIPLSSLNLKATTEEHLGFTGRQEGIAAHCVCLLESK
jgi:2-C-methyl-D-erythritol 2,4-cyclodiphosphate synthase